MAALQNYGKTAKLATCTSAAANTDGLTYLLAGSHSGNASLYTPVGLFCLLVCPFVHRDAHKLPVAASHIPHIIYKYIIEYMYSEAAERLLHCAVGLSVMIVGFCLYKQLTTPPDRTLPIFIRDWRSLNVSEVNQQSNDSCLDNLYDTDWDVDTTDRSYRHECVCILQELQSVTQKSGYRKLLVTSGPDFHRFRYTPTHGFVVFQSLVLSTCARSWRTWCTCTYRANIKIVSVIYWG